ncbi:MaoC/PaaZ C-terminal domain-containing protein [Azospirillum sp. ST 5-10]|uniref:MaoC/PaaZ C-terminal domain-containing protein n=1 Tax=unclassified Azospirillum TaxID=2630922 RepID=UPI003F4A7928
MAEAGLPSFAALAPGRRFESPARTVTETDLAMSAMLSGDWSAIHADAPFAAGTPAGRTVLHGSFGVMLALGFAARVLRLREPVLALLGLKEWRFAAPLVPGDTVRLEVEVVSTRVTGSGDRGVLESRLTLRRQDGAVVQEGLHALLLGLAAAPAPPPG